MSNSGHKQLIYDDEQEDNIPSVYSCIRFGFFLNLSENLHAISKCFSSKKMLNNIYLHLHLRHQFNLLVWL